MPGSQNRYPTYPEPFTPGAVFRRPPSQPPGQSANVVPAQRPFSPAFVPSRPATAIGVLGILGEGIYKVSRVSSASSSRPRLRKTPTILEHQGQKFYTVSKHFDKTLGRGDIIQASSGRYPAPRLSVSSSLRSDDAALGLAGVSTASPIRIESHEQHDQMSAIPLQPPMRPSSVLEAISPNPRYFVKPRRLHTINDTPSSELSFGLDESRYQFTPRRFADGTVGASFSQPAPYRSEGCVDDMSITSSSQTLIGLPNREEMEDDWLLRISQIHHEGLCEAATVWDEFMRRAASEMKSTESSGLGSEAMSDVLVKYESEFTRRWDAVLAATAQKMRDARAEGFAF